MIPTESRVRENRTPGSTSGGEENVATAETEAPASSESCRQQLLPRAYGRARLPRLYKRLTWNELQQLFVEIVVQPSTGSGFGHEFNMHMCPVVIRNEPIPPGPAACACFTTAWPCRGGARSMTGSASPRGTSRPCAAQCRYPVCAECGQVCHQTGPRPPSRQRSGV